MMSVRSRKPMSILTILIIALAIGFFLKSVKLGLIIGLALGLLAGGMMSSGKK